jgi:hypothetical protein
MEVAPLDAEGERCLGDAAARAEADVEAGAGAILAILDLAMIAVESMRSAGQVHALLERQRQRRGVEHLVGGGGGGG